MSLSPPTAAAFAAELAHAVVDGQEEAWPRLRSELDQLSGRDWLVLDAAARSYRLNHAMPVAGVRGWLGPNLGEPSGLVAAVTSLHVDGRFRERAALALAGMSGGIAVSAAAVRLLDHVEQVRAAASQSIAAMLVAQPVPDLLVRSLDVVLAGRDRFQGPAALQALERLGERQFNKHDYVELLIGAPARRVRRHGFEVANELGLLTVPRLLEAVRLEEDQLIVAWCADWLYERAAPSDFADLLDARGAFVRQVAVLRVDDTSLPDAQLLQRAADRAPRVREAARFRARKRGLDIAGWYRDQLDDPEQPATRKAVTLDGLLGAGDASDLPAFQAAMADPRPRIRAVALRGVATWSTREETINLAEPMLLDPSTRVSASAARVLARAGAPSSAADDAWDSPRPGSRRAAWFLARATGGWNAVESDLRLATDADPELAGLGRSHVSNWLTTRAATTWQPLPEHQKVRIAALLDAWDASIDLKRTLAFHAGVRPLPGETRPPTQHGDVVPRKRKWWRR